MDGKHQSPPQHQVFINFRGKELRNNFISHLEKALKDRGIKIFIDTNEDKGEDLSNLFKRIQESRIALVVFSNRYTESRWCLDELVKIKEHLDEGSLKVLPIFYKVSTSDVKDLKGEFGNHFRDREKEFRYEESKIITWKKALECISSIIGLRSNTESSESNFIGSIVTDILKLLEKISSTEQTPKFQANQFLGKGETSISRKHSENSILKTPQENLNKTQPKKSIGFGIGGSSLANPTNVSGLGSAPSWNNMGFGSSGGNSFGECSCNPASLGSGPGLSRGSSIAPSAYVFGFVSPSLRAPYSTTTPRGWTTESTGMNPPTLGVSSVQGTSNIGQHAGLAYARRNGLTARTNQSRPGLQLSQQPHSMIPSNVGPSSNAYNNHNASYGSFSYSRSTSSINGSSTYSYVSNQYPRATTTPISHLPSMESSDDDSDFPSFPSFPSMESFDDFD